MIRLCAAEKVLVRVEDPLFLDEPGSIGIGYQEKIALRRLEDLSVCIDAVNVAEVLERAVQCALMEFDGYVVSSGIGCVEAVQAIWC